MSIKDMDDFLKFWQEVIGDVVFPPYKGDSYKFHAAGREDIDVSCSLLYAGAKQHTC